MVDGVVDFIYPFSEVQQHKLNPNGAVSWQSSFWKGTSWRLLVEQKSYELYSWWDHNASESLSLPTINYVFRDAILGPFMPPFAS